MNADGQVRWLHPNALNKFNLSLENIAIDSVQYLLKLCHHEPSIYI